MAHIRSVIQGIALVHSVTVALSALVAHPATADVLFWPARLELATRPDPAAVAALDLDTDGAVDLAVAHRGSGDVQIWFGHGDGTFVPGPTYLLDIEHPAAMAVADVNTDASPDLITADQVSGAISVLLGQGDGIFASAVVSPGLAGTVALSVGDVDGDQLPDVATAGTMLGILRGQGGGTFAAPTVISTPYGYRAVLLTDLDHDGRLDLLTGSSGLEVRMGNGDGTFAPPTAYTVGVVTAIVAGELAGDGDLDVAVAGDDGIPFVQALEGQGNGALLPLERAPIPGPPLALAIGHLDRDADLDLAAVGYVEFASTAEGTHRITQGGLAVLLNHGDGTFADAVQHEAGQAPQALAIANLDRDGAADVVIANRNGAVAVLLGTGDGTLAATAFMDLAWNESPRTIALADLDRDGALDLLMGVEHYFAGLQVRLGHGDGTFDAAVPYPVHGPSSIAVTDLDGDGELDVATRHANGDAAVLLGRGDGTLGAPAFYPLVDDLNAIAAGDLTGDGVPDLAGVKWAGMPQSGRFAVARGRGDGTFDSPVSQFADERGRALAIDDLTGDGLPDLVLLFEPWNHTTGRLRLERNRGDGGLAWLGSYPTGDFPRALALGDLDRDGDSDIAIANSGSGDVWVYVNSGDGQFVILDPVSVGSTPSALSIADMTGDGMLDLVVANHEGGNVAVLAGAGDATFSAPAWYGVIPWPDALAAGPIDGNRGLDLVVGGHLVSRISLLLSAPRQPVVVDIAAFTATASPTGVIVRWEAAEESGVLGYHVHRAAEGTAGQRVQVTRDLVLAGAGRYAVADAGVPPGPLAYWLEEVARSGESHWIGPRPVTVARASRALHAWAEPVPFAEETAFVIAREAAGAVRLRIYDLAGRLVNQLFDPGIPAGETLRLHWAGTDANGRQLPAGVYFYRVEDGSASVSGKVTIAR